MIDPHGMDSINVNSDVNDNWPTVEQTWLYRSVLKISNNI